MARQPQVLEELKVPSRPVAHVSTTPKSVRSGRSKQLITDNSGDKLKQLSRSPALPKQNKNLLNFANKSRGSSKRKFRGSNGSNKSEILKHVNSGQLPIINELHSLHSTSSKSHGKNEAERAERNSSHYAAIDKFLFED